jgi:hypothetical protein
LQFFKPSLGLGGLRCAFARWGGARIGHLGQLFHRICDDIFRMESGHGNYTPMFCGELLGCFKSAITSEKDNWNVAGGRIRPELVKNLANAGRLDIHIDEDCFQVGHIASHADGIAASIVCLRD